MNTIHRLALAAAALLAAGAASAAPPANLAGPTRTVQANRSPEQLVITQQGSASAPKGAPPETTSPTPSPTMTWADAPRRSAVVRRR